jgi:NADH/NAD ratio-sensing transcriptional regulator Rex
MRYFVVAVEDEHADEFAEALEEDVVAGVTGFKQVVLGLPLSEVEIAT